MVVAVWVSIVTLSVVIAFVLWLKVGYTTPISRRALPGHILLITALLVHGAEQLGGGYTKRLAAINVLPRTQVVGAVIRARCSIVQYGLEPDICCIAHQACRKTDVNGPIRTLSFAEFAAMRIPQSRHRMRTLL